MSDKICCVFNMAPHYRGAIYRLMDEELNCDFYFGSRIVGSIKQMDYEKLVGFKGILKTTNIGNTSFEWQKGLFNLIFKPYKYYIITGFPHSLSNWPLLLVAKIFGKKVIPWAHGMKGNPNTKHKWLERWFYKLSDKVLLYGNHSRYNMIKKGFPKDKLICIYNSLDYEEQVAVRKTLSATAVYHNHFKNKLPVVVYIGRIQESKKLDILVKAVNQLKKTNKECNLVFIGEDVENNAIPELVKNLELEENVWFYGPSYNEKEIGNLLYNADVCVSPGPIGLTALHAMTYGLPVVSNNDFTSQMPEHEVIIEGVTGGFFEEGDFQDLVRTINSWTGLDTTKRDNVRKNAYKVIEEKFTPFYQIEVLKKLFQNKVQ